MPRWLPALRPRPAWLAAVMIPLCLAAGCVPRSGPAPNIIVLMVDTLRADYLGFYGFDGPISPNLDRLAADSIVFENCFAQSPWTKPSVASLFTSLYPQVHQLTNHEGKYWGPADANQRTGVLSDNAVTLAEVLQEAGYRTAGFVSNPWVGGAYGFAQGFDHYDETAAAVWADADVPLASARRWIETLPAETPFFVYLHFMDVHAPYDAPRADYDAVVDAPSLGNNRSIEHQQTPFFRFRNIEHRPEWATVQMRHELRYWRARYAAGVRAFDRRLGAFLDYLRQSGLSDTTLIVFTSDHGEELYEHEGWSHGQNLYDHQLHVPLLWRNPGGVEGGRREPALAELVDLMPTLLVQAGLEPPRQAQGRDVFDSPAAQDGEEVSFATATQRTPDLYSVRTPRYKLHHNLAHTGSWLFDLTTDPGELNDVADRSPEVVDRLKRRLGSHLEQSLAAGALEPESTELPEATLERLRSLGYID